MSRRHLLNFFTGTAIVVTVGGALYPVVKFLIPPSDVEKDGSILAKDIHGNLIPIAQILAEPPETRALVAGLAGAFNC